MKIKFVFNDAETPDENRNRLVSLFEDFGLTEEYLKQMEDVLKFYDKNKSISKNIARMKVSSTDEYLKKLNSYATALRKVIKSVDIEEVDVEGIGVS